MCGACIPAGVGIDWVQNRCQP